MRMAVAPAKKAPAKRQAVKFVLDCTKPVDDLVLDTAYVEQYFSNRVKVDGKTNNLGDRVSISRDRTKVYVQAETPFSKRYIKYLTKKYLKKQMLRDFLRVVATTKNTYELRYFTMSTEEPAAEA